MPATDVFGTPLSADLQTWHAPATAGRGIVSAPRPRPVSSAPSFTANAAASVQKAQADANAANQARYNQLLDLANQYGIDALKANQTGYDQTAGAYGQIAQNQLQQNDRLTGQELARTQQSAISRGLGNTTVADTLRAGVQRNAGDRAQSINAAYAGQLAGLRQNTLANELGILGQQFGARKDIIQGRTDAGPDMSLWAQLLAAPK